MKKLTPTQKKALMIGGGLLAAYILYRVVKPGSDSSGNAVDPTGNGGGATNPNFNAKQLAESLYEGMYEMGTDDEDILPTIQLIPTQAQFGQVNTQFDSRPYNPLTGNIYAVWPFDLDKYPLKYWLKNELSDEAYAVIKKKYPNYLTGFRPRRVA